MCYLVPKNSTFFALSAMLFPQYFSYNLGNFSKHSYAFLLLKMPSNHAVIYKLVRYIELPVSQTHHSDLQCSLTIQLRNTASDIHRSQRSQFSPDCLIMIMVKTKSLHSKCTCFEQLTYTEKFYGFQQLFSIFLTFFFLFFSSFNESTVNK